MTIDVRALPTGFALLAIGGPAAAFAQTPATEVAAGLVNEARQKAGVAPLKPDPILAEHARGVVAEFIAGGQKATARGTRLDTRKQLKALLDRGYAAKQLHATVKEGAIEAVLASVFSGPPRMEDFIQARNRAYTQIGAARGSDAAGQEFFVLIYATPDPSAGPAEAKAPPARPRSEAAPAPGRAREAGAGAGRDTPEDATRAFLMAMYGGDVKSLRDVCLDPDGLDQLARMAKMPPAALGPMKDKLDKLPIRRLRAGEKAGMSAGGSFVVSPAEAGPEDAVVVAEGSSGPLRLKKVDGRWKVDAAPMVQGLKAVDAMKKAGAPRKR